MYPRVRRLVQGGIAQQGGYLGVALAFGKVGEDVVPTPRKRLAGQGRLQAFQRFRSRHRGSSVFMSS
jgi:hypothetical protein